MYLYVFKDSVCEQFCFFPLNLNRVTPPSIYLCRFNITYFVTWLIFILLFLSISFFWSIIINVSMHYLDMSEALAAMYLKFNSFICRIKLGWLNLISWLSFGFWFCPLCHFIWTKTLEIILCSTPLVCLQKLNMMFM